MGSFIKKQFREEYPVFAHPEETLDEHIAKCEHYLHRLDEDKDIRGVIKRYVEKKFARASGKLYPFVWELFAEMISAHDAGKMTPEFQRKKMKNEAVPKEDFSDGSGNHSLLSAVIYMDAYLSYLEQQDFDKTEKHGLRKIIKLNSYVISRHHSGLKEYRDFEDNLLNGSGVDLRKCLEEKGLCGYHLQRIKDAKWIGGEKKFDEWDYFYCRFAYSVLVACDYYATTEQMNNVAYNTFGNLEDMEEMACLYESSALMQKIRRFEKKGAEYETDEMNALRSRLFLEVEKQFKENADGDIYFLKAPTGSGKSNVALNLSFQMMRHGGKKLFYIYPFNTLVEQNRENLMQLFAGKSVASNIAVVNALTPLSDWKRERQKGRDEKDEDSEEYYLKAVLDRQFLNYPCVLSTHVSFFDILFGAKKESVLGFYQLTNSVVVLDEIQSYPPHLWGEIMLSLQCITKLLKMKVIIMSATLPDLTKLSGQQAGVIQMPQKAGNYFSNPVFSQRVKISMELLKDESITLEELKNHILQYHGSGQKVLVEFMTKKSAESFYQIMISCEEVKIPVKCITGDDSLFTREEILAPILKNEMKEVLLIATQVVEAGVDIDMDVGYKNLSKLDSEEQFLGRINRSCRKSGIAYFFKVDEAKKIYQDDIRMERQLTLEEPQMQDLLHRKDFEAYYEGVLPLIKKFSLERTDHKGIEFLKQDLLRFLNFPEIEKRMQMIQDQDTVRSVFFNRKIRLKDGTALEGEKVWRAYEALLQNEDISYSEKRVRLSEVRVQMSHFIYQLRYNEEVLANEWIGELAYVDDGEDYFENGRLNRERLLQSTACII